MYDSITCVTRKHVIGECVIHKTSSFDLSWFCLRVSINQLSPTYYSLMEFTYRINETYVGCFYVFRARIIYARLCKA